MSVPKARTEIFRFGLFSKNYLYLCQFCTDCHETLPVIPGGAEADLRIDFTSSAVPDLDWCGTSRASRRTEGEVGAARSGEGVASRPPAGSANIEDWRPLFRVDHNEEGEMEDGLDFEMPNQMTPFGSTSKRQRGHVVCRGLANQDFKHAVWNMCEQGRATIPTRVCVSGKVATEPDKYTEFDPFEEK
ncbi:hypothetical protein B0H14DRAFT_2594419 [Mycena olivaceomarginata]|nr:hypothetical protein B0H14DRAFT_2594419 [Mycena olivaceomarginata]